MFRDLMAVREQIAAEFHERAVDINVMNGTRMTVKFVNSPFNAKSSEEKQQHADAIGAFAVAHYKHPLTGVSVQYISKTGVAGVSAMSSETFIARLQSSDSASATR